MTASKHDPLQRPGQAAARRMSVDAGTLTALRMLAERATPSIDEIAQIAANTIYRDIPAYRENRDPNIVSQVADHCRTVFLAVMSCMREGRVPQLSDFPTTAAYALNRVGQGLALADFLQAFRIGQSTLWQHLGPHLAALKASGDLTARAVMMLMEVIELGSTAAAEAYVEAEHYRRADHDRVRRDLIEDLLAGRPPALPLRRGVLHAARLGEYTPTVVASARLVAPEDGESLSHVRALELQMESGPFRGLVGARHAEVVGIFPVGDDGTALAEHLRAVRDALLVRGQDTAIGLSTRHAGWAELPTAYREACIACDGLRGAGGVLPLGSLSPLSYLVLTDDLVARRLIDQRIRAFIEEELGGGGTYLETLEAYVASDLNAKVAADRLHVHVNTAYYRLERITERTGRDLRSFDQVLDLVVAVRLLRAEHAAH